MPADILLYAVIAAGLVVWLRNILGTRSEDEPRRPNPFAATPEASSGGQSPAAAPGSQGPASQLIQSAGLSGTNEAEQLQTMIAGLDRKMSIESEAAVAGLAAILRTDRSFDLSHFLNGAQDAFVVIVESFAEGDKETLSGLLSPALYKAFETVIDERAAKGETGSVEIHAVRHVEVLEASVKDKTAFITVKFTADETNILRDKDGSLLSGDPERVTETIDIWTFGRNLRSRDPAWLLYETREEEKPVE